MYRFDYTDNPLSAQAASTVVGSTIRGISLLERDQGVTESVWVADNSRVSFVDRTTDMSTENRFLTHGQLQSPWYLYQFLTPLKLILLENQSHDQFFVIDYSETAITVDYYKNVCGANVANSRLAVIEGTTRGIFICKNSDFKYVELNDGSVLSTVSAGFNKGWFVHILRDKRILIAYGQTSSSNYRISLWDLSNEIHCHSSCASCGFDVSAGGCTSCPVTKVLRLDSSCSETCSGNDEYVDNSKNCQKCDTSCLTCSSGGPNGCSDCPDPKFKRTDNSCQDSCATNEYNAGSRVCQACDASCLTCSSGSPASCLTCPSTKFKRTDDSCMDSCALDEYYVDGSHSCMACHPTCESCKGPSASECSSCDSRDYRRPMIDQKCPPCKRETCPRCPKDSLCDWCLLDPSIDGCPILIDYSLSVETRGDLPSGDISIYLIVKPNSEDLESGDTQFMRDYQYFFIKADKLDFVGSASYNNSTKFLKEKGRIVDKFSDTIEFHYLEFVIQNC